MNGGMKKSNFRRLAVLILVSLGPTFISNSYATGFLRLTSVETDPWERFLTATKKIQDTPEIRAFLGRDQSHGLSVIQKISGHDLETTKFQHYYRGIEVIGSLAFHHKNAREAWVSNKLKNFDLNTEPSLTTEEAVAIAKSVAGDRNLRNVPTLKILPSTTENSAKLVYWIELGETGLDGARKVIIDAHSGKVIGNLSENMELAPIKIYSAKNRGITVIPVADTGGQNLKGCTIINLTSGEGRFVDLTACKQAGRNQCQLVMDGAPVMINPRYCAQAPSPPKVTTEVKEETLIMPIWDWDSNPPEITVESDDTTSRALENSQKVLNYYMSTHRRNSYDDDGSPVVSVVHAGIAYSNAHWDVVNNRMVYGDGDGKNLGDFTLALDVTGHEITHGITSMTAQLLGMGEAGALNEAYSDFFGKMIDYNGDWAIGKNLFLKDREKVKGIRDLAQPQNIINRLTNRPYPAKMSEKLPDHDTCDETNDYCYVHANATIPGHASYLVVQGIGKYKAERLYYTVLTQALGSNETFKSAAEETRKMCAKMYDNGTCFQVDKALAQVGL